MPILLARYHRQLAGRDVIVFIDNEGALASLIRGATGEADAEFVCQVVHCLALRLHVRIWWDWVDSKSNPADALSRAGLLAPRVLSGEWVCEDITPSSFPAWEVQASPWQAADELLQKF